MRADTKRILEALEREHKGVSRNASKAEKELVALAAIADLGYEDGPTGEDLWRAQMLSETMGMRAGQARSAWLMFKVAVETRDALERLCSEAGKKAPDALPGFN